MDILNTRTGLWKPLTKLFGARQGGHKYSLAMMQGPWPFLERSKVARIGVTGVVGNEPHRHRIARPLRRPHLVQHPI